MQYQAQAGGATIWLGSGGAEARSLWHLVSSGRRPVWCKLRHTEHGFQLILITGEEVFVTSSGDSMEDAHAAAARWRAALESKGYSPAQ